MDKHFKFFGKKQDWHNTQIRTFIFGSQLHCFALCSVVKWYYEIAYKRAVLPTSRAAFALQKSGDIMLIKKCTRCGKLFPYHTGSLCPACVSDADRRDNDKIYNQRYRNKQSDRFYHSAEWKRLSKVVLAKAQYRCAECGGLAVEVHHIIPVRDDWSKRLDIHNLVPLCTSCHNRKRQG